MPSDEGRAFPENITRLAQFGRAFQLRTPHANSNSLTAQAGEAHAQFAYRTFAMWTAPRPHMKAFRSGERSYAPPR